MDILREPAPQRRRYLLWTGVVTAGLALTLAVGRLEPTIPTVERGAIVIDSVRRGDMTVDIRATGTLVPEHARIIAAVTAGRVEALPVRPGVGVGPATLLVRLSNSDVELQARQSEQQLSAALSGLATLRMTLRQQRLLQESEIAQLTTQYRESDRNARAMESLSVKALAAANEVAGARDRMQENELRLTLARQRLADMVAAERDQLTLMQDQVARLQAIVDLQRQRVAAMRVVAGESGQLQALPLELGQWVNPGMELARVAQAGRLKALLKVPEAQAKDVLPGQRATVDTHDGVASAVVARVEPGSQNGAVLVEVTFDGPLPAGARPDLSIDGTIQIAMRANVLSIDRPAMADADGTINLFKIEPNGKEAVRVRVKLGVASSTAIEVVDGLHAGDLVVVSDMAAWDTSARLRLK